MSKFGNLKILIIEKYQRLKIKNMVQKKVESRIFEEELAKLKTESKTKKHDEIRERAKTAAKMSNKGIPKNIALGLASSASELKKSKEKIEEVQKELSKHQRPTPKKSASKKNERGLSDLFITNTDNKSKKKKEAYPWSMD